MESSGLMELSTMDQSGVFTVPRVISSMTVISCSSRMFRFGKNNSQLRNNLEEIKYFNFYLILSVFFSITKRSAFLLKHYYGIGILLSSYNAGTGTYLNAMKLTLKSFFLKNKHRSDLNTIIKLNSVLRSRSRPF